MHSCEFSSSISSCPSSSTYTGDIPLPAFPGDTSSPPPTSTPNCGAAASASASSPALLSLVTALSPPCRMASSCAASMLRLLSARMWEGMYLLLASAPARAAVDAPSRRAATRRVRTVMAASSSVENVYVLQPWCGCACMCVCLCLCATLMFLLWPFASLILAHTYTHRHTRKCTKPFPPLLVDNVAPDELHLSPCACAPIQKWL